MEYVNNPRDDMSAFNIPPWLGPKAAVGLVAVVFVVIGLITSFYKVDTDENAVILRFGKFNRITEPGLHMRLPFGIETAYNVKTTRIISQEFGFRSMSTAGRSQYRKEGFEEESLMLTGDLNVVDLEFIVQYRVSNPYNFLFKVESPSSTVRDLSESIARRVVGDSNVIDVLTLDRVAIAQRIQDELQEILDRYSIGVHIVTVRFQDVNPPAPVRAAFNAVNEAEQHKESLILQAEERFNEKVFRAKGEADRMISEAEGYALERVNRAEGEVRRFVALMSEYKQSPIVTRNRLYLETLEKIIPRFAKTYIIDSKDSGESVALPILPLKGFEGGLQ